LEVLGLEPDLLASLELGWWCLMGGAVDGLDRLCMPFEGGLLPVFHVLVKQWRGVHGVDVRRITKEGFRGGDVDGGIFVIVVHHGGYPQPVAPVSLGAVDGQAEVLLHPLIRPL
jgi:hypothetical protein